MDHTTESNPRKDLRRTVQAFLLLAVFALPVVLSAGCKAPCAWPYRTLHITPKNADQGAATYWERCEASKQNDGPTPGEAANHLPTLMDHAETRKAEPVVPASLVNYQPEPIQDPLRLPPSLPGANTKPLVIPNLRNLDKAQQREEIANIFPDLLPVPRRFDAVPEPTGSTIGLESLHQLADANHPSLRAAAAAVESARGLMIQAGLPPNPKMGYEADTVRTLNTAGYQGAYLQQTIVTARKLGLAAEAAAVDYANAIIEQRKTWVTISSNVRRSYFQVLAARERAKLAEALLELSSRSYHAHVDLVAAGEAAPYEPLQLRVLTTQARASLIRAQQDAIASWRTLAAAAGLPDLEVSVLEGHIDCAVPSIDYDNALERLVAVHTDIQMAQNVVRKQQRLVTLADRTPIPNLDVGFVLQKDFTWQPGTTSYNLMLGGEIPVWNQNQGNRIATRADLVRAGQQIGEVRLTLISGLASTYAVYQANRELAGTFRTDALRDQVRAYRGVYQRYLADPSGVSFNDVIVAQQTLAAVLNQYLDILQSQWQSVVELGRLLQVEDIFELGELEDVAQLPDLEPLPDIE